MGRQGNLGLLLIAVSIVSSCKIADLRTAQIDTTSPQQEEKAVAFLDNVISKYQLNKLVSAENYSFEATDNWRGLYAIINPFPKDNEPMELRFRPGSFDGQFNYLGTHSDNIYGVQSFNYYQIKRGGTPKFKKKKSGKF